MYGFTLPNEHKNLRIVSASKYEYILYFTQRFEWIIRDRSPLQVPDTDHRTNNSHSSSSWLISIVFARNWQWQGRRIASYRDDNDDGRLLLQPGEHRKTVMAAGSSCSCHSQKRYLTVAVRLGPLMRSLMVTCRANPLTQSTIFIRFLCLYLVQYVLTTGQA